MHPPLWLRGARARDGAQSVILPYAPKMAPIYYEQAYFIKYNHQAASKIVLGNLVFGKTGTNTTGEMTQAVQVVDSGY